MQTKGKGKGMGYHGGKANVGSINKKHNVHFSNPRDAQTRVESSKSMGHGYTPPGMENGKMDCSY